MRSILTTKNKKGQFTDIFLFMIVAVIILFVSGLFIYMGLRTQNQLEESFSGMTIGGEEGGQNYTDVMKDTFGDVNTAYHSLYWISIMLIVGMIISIFLGSYLVTTRPIFFVPYIFIVIIAIFVSVGISNAYQEVITTPELASTFAGFVGANFIMYNLPLWIAIIGFTGGIIMFVRMKSQESVAYGY